MACEIREIASAESLSVELWKEALARVKECAGTAGNVLFIARDDGSLGGLRRHHGSPGQGSGFTSIPPKQARLLYDLGMTFRYAFLIQPSDDLVAGVTPLVSDLLIIARREPTQKGLAKG